MMKKNFNCNMLSLAWLLLLLNLAPCYMQKVTPSTLPQQRDPQPHRSGMTARWNNRQLNAAPSVATNCEYKDLMSSLHDRVGLLATLDEDQRNRLETIDKKIVQFETSNLARLESLGAQQMDFLKRLESMELTQRLTHNGIEELKGEFDKDGDELRVKSKNERNSTRSTRQTLPQILPQAIGDDDADESSSNIKPLQDNEKTLDDVYNLLISTRASVFFLQLQLQANLTKLIQVTNALQKRITNLQRRQGTANTGSFQPAVVPNFYATAPSQPQLITSCGQGAPTRAGVLRIQLTPASEPFYVYCDEQTFGGGWTIIQKRFNGDINFQRGWAEYKAGFGNLAGEFFIGLDKLHALTSSTVHELLIVLQDFNDMERVAKYSLFAIGNEDESYALNLLGSYAGNAGDAMSYHAGSKFSTYDNDNDGCVDCNCAQSHNGAWWYNWCEQTNLNGKYFDTDYDKVPTYQGVYWHHFHGPNYSLKSVRMMIRPVPVDEENRR